MNVLANLKSFGTLVLQWPFGLNDLEEKLPSSTKREIAGKRLKFFVFEVAADNKLASQVAAFCVFSGLLKDISTLKPVSTPEYLSHIAYLIYTLGSSRIPSTSSTLHREVLTVGTHPRGSWLAGCSRKPGSPTSTESQVYSKKESPPGKSSKLATRSHKVFDVPRGFCYIRGTGAFNSLHNILIWCAEITTGYTGGS